MKLFLLTFEVKFKQDTNVLTIKDQMIVPEKTEASAKKRFLATIEKVGRYFCASTTRPGFLHPSAISAERSLLQLRKAVADFLCGVLCTFGTSY